MTINLSHAVIGCIFAVVAFMHLVRLIYKTEVMIGGKKLPLWVSIFGVIIPALLSVWMFTT